MHTHQAGVTIWHHATPRLVISWPPRTMACCAVSQPPHPDTATSMPVPRMGEEACYPNLIPSLQPHVHLNACSWTACAQGHHPSSASDSLFSEHEECLAQPHSTWEFAPSDGGHRHAVRSVIGAFGSRACVCVVDAVINKGHACDVLLDMPPPRSWSRPLWPLPTGADTCMR